MEPAYKLEPQEDHDNLTWEQANLEAWRQVKSREKKKKTEESDSVWLVSYADLMTLLVGFFAMLLSFSKIEPQKFEEVKQAVAEEFETKYENPYIPLAETIRQVVLSQEMEKMVDVETSAQGVTITFRDAVFFDTGSAAVKPEAEPLLTRLIQNIKPQVIDFDVVVEGHTDNVPMKSDEVTNWELSGLRAARVVRSFQGQGFDPSRLQGVGFGETRPLIPNWDEDGVPSPENQARNRRVVVKLIKHFQTEAAVPPKASGKAPASVPER